MDFRHEWKYEINRSDFYLLRQRLNCLLQPDPHACADGSYFISSLYFDNGADKALHEKLDGVDPREKYRLRYYNQDPELIFLERKRKVNGLCQKSQTPISKQDARELLQGRLTVLQTPADPLRLQLYQAMLSQGLRPKTIVTYRRYPYIYGPGNVRVTLDQDIRTGVRSLDYLNPQALTIPAGDPIMLLEVKWDQFLPDFIRDLLRVPDRRSAAFSKYAISRIFG
ncbi:MAG: polyphosphate polymerase domain-containing protein [Oscillospiraceae bacterium]|nr:polyphosphate polymerase domain-containing protein [Oscillospiraceae bacterium]